MDTARPTDAAFAAIAVARIRSTCSTGHRWARTGILGRADFPRMAELLRQLKGKFILSLNDRVSIRRGPQIRPSSVLWTVCAPILAK